MVSLKDCFKSTCHLSTYSANCQLIERGIVCTQAHSWFSSQWNPSPFTFPSEAGIIFHQFQNGNATALKKLQRCAKTVLFKFAYWQLLLTAPGGKRSNFCLVWWRFGLIRCAAENLWHFPERFFWPPGYECFCKSERPSGSGVVWLMSKKERWSAQAVSCGWWKVAKQCNCVGICLVVCFLDQMKHRWRFNCFGFGIGLSKFVMYLKSKIKLNLKKYI